MISDQQDHRTAFLLSMGIITLFLLPVLIILMLPSLVFGPQGLDHPSENVLNDDLIITENILEIEKEIEKILWKKHDQLIEEIEKEAKSLDENCEYEIIDTFADEIIFESTLIISQFCAYTQDYKETHLQNLKEILEVKTAEIFHYHTDISTYEKVISEAPFETQEITLYTYTIEYECDTYFSEQVFCLDSKQHQLAADYASNLHLYLGDVFYDVTINQNLTPGETGSTAVDLALTKIGTPYSQAKRNHPGYFDCSSFTYWIYSQLGISLTYGGSNTAASQGRYIAENNLAISYDNLAPGDLIFYSTKTNQRYMNITHVALYCGNGYVVDASYGQQKVVYRPIYNTDNIVLCGRPYP